MRKDICYQFDYFSENFKRFEEDFYKIAKTTTPLIFLTDDLLKVLSSNGKNYFRLSSDFTKDEKDHFFFFQKKEQKENSKVILYQYLDCKKSG